MSLKIGTLSLTRPTNSDAAISRDAWQVNAGLLLALTGTMLLAAFFGLTIVIAGWVADLHGSDAGNASLLGRVNSYEAWLLPVAVASIALAKFGIAVVLHGIIRQLWTRVDSVKQSLPVLVAHGRTH
jgi:hypothetical protein